MTGDHMSRVVPLICRVAQHPAIGLYDGVNRVCYQIT